MHLSHKSKTFLDAQGSADGGIFKRNMRRESSSVDEKERTYVRSGPKLRGQRTQIQINVDLLLILGGRSVREYSADCRRDTGRLVSQAQQTPDVAFPYSA